MKMMYGIALLFLLLITTSTGLKQWMETWMFAFVYLTVLVSIFYGVVELTADSVEPPYKDFKEEEKN